MRIRAVTQSEAGVLIRLDTPFTSGAIVIEPEDETLRHDRWFVEGVDCLAVTPRNGR